MKRDEIKFKIRGTKVMVESGYPELEGCTGTNEGCGMAVFFGKNRELYIANTKRGEIRKFSSEENVLVDDSEIDYEAIIEGCTYGILSAAAKEVRYDGINRWDGFKSGLCALTWTLYPDGRFFADEDGFGMEDNDEEVAYAIINTNLEIVEPFRPVKNIDTYLRRLRKGCKVKK